MAILNVTPDSFSDGGRHLAACDAVTGVKRMVAQGADIVDIGGESTRPGARPIEAATELERVLPVLEEIKKLALDTAISIDTTKAAIAEAAIDAGATIVNDISAARFEPEIVELCADRGVGICLMHMQGSPQTMQLQPSYADVVGEVKAFLSDRIEYCLACGIAEDKIWIDPGIGFGKTLEHNVKLLAGLDQIAELGQPVVIGTSRKSFLAKLVAREDFDPVAATVATNILAFSKGAAIFRVHDVVANRSALDTWARLP